MAAMGFLSTELLTMTQIIRIYGDDACPHHFCVDDNIDAGG